MFSQRKKCRNRKKRSDKTLFSQVMGQLSGERSPGIYGHFRTCCCLKVCYFYDIIKEITRGKLVMGEKKCQVLQDRSYCIH